MYKAPMDGPFAEIDEPRILYEDESLIAVLKPCGMHSAPLRGGGASLCEWLFERRPDAASLEAVSLGGPGSDGEEGSGDGGAGEPDDGLARRSPAEGGLLHRLDRDTSGILLFARSPTALRALLASQDAGLFRKEYLALVDASEAQYPLGSRPPRGFPRGIAAGAWNSALSRAARGSGHGELAALISQAIGEGGKPGISCAFRPFGAHAARVACLGPGSENSKGGRKARVAVYECGFLAVEAMGESLLLRLSLEKGFRHQLRAQLAWIGAPIRGDGIYGGRKGARLMLHAAALSFPHPGTSLVSTISCYEYPRL